MMPDPTEVTNSGWDATNAVRLCDRCELERGVSADADKGDQACSVCGQHHAPNVYVGLATYDELAKRPEFTPEEVRVLRDSINERMRTPINRVYRETMKSARAKLEKVR